jgi:hypothetical protein
MSNEKRPTYNNDEAEFWVERAHDHLYPDTKGRVLASEALFEALLSLSRNGFNVNVDERLNTTIHILVGSYALRLSYNERDGKIAMSERSGPEAPFPGLVFNPAEKKWEGEGPDEFHVYKPGEKPPARSAVAVVVERVVKGAGYKRERW